MKEQTSLTSMVMSITQEPHRTRALRVLVGILLGLSVLAAVLTVRERITAQERHEALLKNGGVVTLCVVLKDENAPLHQRIEGRDDSGSLVIRFPPGESCTDAAFLGPHIVEFPLTPDVHSLVVEGVELTPDSTHTVRFAVDVPTKHRLPLIPARPYRP